MIAWTTTPWTLPSNLALVVHPVLQYVKIKGRINFGNVLRLRLVTIVLYLVKIRNCMDFDFERTSGSEAAWGRFSHTFSQRGRHEYKIKVFKMASAILA